MASVDAANPPSPPRPRLPSHGGIRVDDLKRIDISQLSQSELQALSLCSDSSFDVRRTDDVVSPHLDRSVFNESAGSRRQTYSASIIAHTPAFLATTLPLNPTDTPTLPPIPKSKNLNKKKLLENGVGIELQEVNGKGEVVDFAELEKKGDELYGEELKRRTVGLETEEDVLGFLSGLEGQWCSRRKKRKYVDAGLLGDALPIGWKLLLGLRRRDYRVSVYCRRCIRWWHSKSLLDNNLCHAKRLHLFEILFWGNDANQQRDQKTCSIQEAYVLSSGKNACPADKSNVMARDIVVHSTLAGNASNSHENDDCLMGIENLPEVQVKDIFECFKCNLTFDEKNLYLQHLFSFHQKTTKRYKFGTPVGEGVIINDGKYECQFCHKMSKKSESPLQDAVPPRSSKMDALIEIAQNSIFESPTIGTGEQAITDHSASVLRLEETHAAPSDHDGNLSSDPVKIQEEDFSAERAVGEDLNRDHKITSENHDVDINDFTWNVNIKMDASCINDLEPAGSSEIENYEHSSLGMSYGNRCLKPSDDHLEDTPGLTVGDIVFQDGVSSVPLAQSFQFFPSFDSVSDKRELEFSVADQKLENVTGFEELRFDDIEPYKYGYMNVQELPSLPESSMNLGNDGGIENGFNSSVGFGSEEVMLNTLDANQLTVGLRKNSRYLVEELIYVFCCNVYKAYAACGDQQADHLYFVKNELAKGERGIWFFFQAQLKDR
ncbi:hypothetical protein DH2020_029786 [Rehmannia glutinosa]|uniref:C2H2-type domain-containing protein n=1 Tax=Rehmannia glutinosa TaxID=99300 RepID=A0ABR0VMK5_REHGL